MTMIEQDIVSGNLDKAISTVQDQYRLINIIRKVKQGKAVMVGVFQPKRGTNANFSSN